MSRLQQLLGWDGLAVEFPLGNLAECLLLTPPSCPLPAPSSFLPLYPQFVLSMTSYDCLWHIMTHLFACPHSSLPPITLPLALLLFVGFLCCLAPCAASCDTIDPDMRSVCYSSHCFVDSLSLLIGSRCQGCLSALPGTTTACYAQSHSDNDFNADSNSQLKH